MILGLFFKENNVVPKLISNGLNTMLWNKVIKCDSTIFYRSKRESRLLDCYYMKLIGVVRRVATTARGSSPSVMGFPTATVRTV